jgi:hypothetical protein
MAVGLKPVLNLFFLLVEQKLGVESMTSSPLGKAVHWSFQELSLRRHSPSIDVQRLYKPN